MSPAAPEPLSCTCHPVHAYPSFPCQPRGSSLRKFPWPLERVRTLSSMCGALTGVGFHSGRVFQSGWLSVPLGTVYTLIIPAFLFLPWGLAECLLNRFLWTGGMGEIEMAKPMNGWVDGGLCPWVAVLKSSDWGVRSPLSQAPICCYLG